MPYRQQSGYPQDSQEQLTPYQPPQPQDPYKASYDDLIDEYATAYDRTSRHQTAAVQMPSNGTSGFHERPYPMESKGSLSTDLNRKSGYSDEVDDDEFSRPPQSYPPRPTDQVETRSFWRRLMPDSMACRLYILTIIVETILDLAIEGDLLVRSHEVDEDSGGSEQVAQRKMPVYLSIFALAHVFQFIMALDAVYSRNTLQFMLLTIFNALFLLYAIIQIGEIQSFFSAASVVPSGISHIPPKILTTIIPIIISVAQVVYMALGWKIYNEFGWKVYKFLGADRQIKKMFANYQIFDCLIKFDVFFWVGFSIQFIWLVLNPSNWEYYVTCAALPLSLVLLVEGHLAARHENKLMMITFMSGCVGALVYFTYKLVKVILLRDSQFNSVFKSLAVFSVIAIILLLITFAFAMIVMNNFGRGLKASMSKANSPQQSLHKGDRQSSYNGGVSANRMSID